MYAKQPPPEAIGGGCPACVHLVKGKKKKEKTRAPAPMWPGARAARGALYSLRTGVRTAGRKTKSADRLWSVSAFAFDEQSITRFVGNVKDPKPLL